MSKNARSRLAPQFEKVLSNTFSADISPRLHHRHVQNDDFHSREEDSQSTSHGLLLIETEDDFMDDSGSVYWDCSGDAAGQPTGSVSDTTPSCSTKSNTVPTDYSSTTADATRIDLVDQSTQQMEWSTSSESSTNNANIHGCIRQRLRDCVERPALSRQMDSHRAIISHQLQRAFSRSENISSHSGATQQSPAALYGQYVSHRLYQEVRRNEITQTEQPRDDHLETLFSQLHTAFHSLCTFENEPSRCSFTCDGSTNRMDITETNVPLSKSPMGTPPLGSICFTTEPSTSSVCELELPPSSSVDQRLQSSLEHYPEPPSLSGATLEPVDDDFTTPTTTTGGSDIDHPKLADSPLVSSSSTTDAATTSHSSPPSGSQKRRRPASEEGTEMDSPGLEHPRKHRVVNSSTSLSKNAVAVISNKTCSVTARQYAYRQQAYQRWCQTRDWDPSAPSAYQLVNYLADNYTFRKWKLSTVQSYANSILLLFPASEQTSIRQSKVYQDFFQGLCQSSIQPNKSWEYNVLPITDYLISLGANSALSPALLTMKTAWLLGVVGFMRPSDLERIDLDNTSILSGNILYLRVLAPKEKRRGSRISKTITIHPHSNSLLCPVAAFVCYREHFASTACMASHPVFPNIKFNALFRSLKDSNVAIGAERLSKHINSVMQYVGRPAGAPLPKARALGATLAAQAGVAVDDIVVHGNWSSKALFEHFYRISVLTNSNFTVTTLDSQQRS